MSMTELPNGWRHVVPNEQRVYRAPEPVAPWRPPEVAAHAIKTEGTVTEQSHAAINHALNGFRKHLEATEAIKGNFTPEGYKAQLDAFQNTAAAKGVDTALENVTARRDAAAANVEKVRKALSPNGDVAAELRATRYTDRAIRTLDAKNSGDLFTAANALLASASREELGTLLQELPAYLQSRGATTDWIDSVVGRIVPEYGAAKTQLQRAESVFQITRQNAQFVRSSFANGSTRVILTDPSDYDPDS